MMCGMPGPDGPVARLWDTCVKPIAGYFNAAYCPGDSTGTATGVLGFALVSDNVCYPVHMHVAQEAYWQIGGRGHWRTWSSFRPIKDASDDAMMRGGTVMHGHKLFEDEDTTMPTLLKRLDNSLNDRLKHLLSGSAQGRVSSIHMHPATLAHEFNTVESTEDFMVMVYMWGKDGEYVEDDYRWVKETVQNFQNTKNLRRKGGRAGSCLELLFEKQHMSSIVEHSRQPSTALRAEWDDMMAAQGLDAVEANKVKQLEFREGCARSRQNIIQKWKRNAAKVLVKSSFDVGNDQTAERRSARVTQMLHGK